jgi:hypothetical protein
MMCSRCEDLDSLGMAELLWKHSDAPGRAGRLDRRLAGVLRMVCFDTELGVAGAL